MMKGQMTVERPFGGIMKTVIFSDIMGFKNYVRQDFRGAVELHEMFQVNMTFNIQEERLHPFASYPDSLREFARDSSLTSFESILPMSDSVFLTSEDASLSAVQWSHFLGSLLRSTTNIYHYPASEADPRDIVETHLIAHATGISTVKEERKRYPLLMKSGISIGDYRHLDTKGLLDYNIVNHYNLVGEGVVAAVGLAQADRRGPFFLCDNKTYNDFATNLKERCVKDGDERYEILWPSYQFIDGNIRDAESLRIELINYEMNLIRPAAYLYEYFNRIAEARTAEQYRMLLRLLGKSFLQYCKIIGYAEAQNLLRQTLKRSSPDLSDWDYDGYPND
jgi:hypothetical protein